MYVNSTFNKINDIDTVGYFIVTIQCTAVGLK